MGNQHNFAAELLATYHLPGVFLRSTAFLHDSFLLYVQMAHYGQPHLACNHVSISNTISAPLRSMLLSAARGSGEIDVPFVRRDSFGPCCSVVQNADARGRRCMKEALLLRQGDKGGKGGGLL